MTSSANWLLANREQLSLEKAATYLVSRLRTRTPLGAAEFLDYSSKDDHFGLDTQGGREIHDERVKLARVKMDIYSRLFPREYKASQSPAFSTLREHELYDLISRRLFPLDFDLTAATRWAFLPFIPVPASQQHDWEAGCCGFDQMRTMFKLALTLTGRKPGGWKQLGLKEEPAPPLDALSWTFFKYAIAVDPSPVRYFVDAINLTCYTTGNVWLDTPRHVGYATVAWSEKNVSMLFLARLQADKINARVSLLDEWLNESPGERIGYLIELWNAAAKSADQDGQN